MSTNFKLCWETFKNNLCDGFSKLQQMEEFVDVTLAAGGCYFKAHQNIIAVASPYLKEMLKSTPCQHPVIFLGPISQSVLRFILEYIYTGEVNVPSNVLPAFVDAAKLLHIAGIKDIQLPQVNPRVNVMKPKKIVIQNSETFSTNNVNNTTDDRHDPELDIDNLDNYEGNIHPDNDELTVNPDESLIDQPLNNNERCDMDLDFENLIKIDSIPRCPADLDNQISQNEQPANSNTENPDENLKSNDCISEVDYHSNTENLDCIPEIDRQMDVASVRLGNDAKSNFLNKTENITTTPLYTRSNRGSLQMVMNRFVYYLHHTSFVKQKQKRRWRCINYRRNRCLAFIDTNGEIIISRKNQHSHEFHDKEIFKLGRKKDFFTSIAEANDRSRQNQTVQHNAFEITDNTEQQKQIEISIEFPFSNE